MEKTLVLIKPDAVERSLIGNIISLYEKNGLKVMALKLVHAGRPEAEEHYKEHFGRPYYDNLISYITRSPLVALVLEGEDAISRVREINGKTDPRQAAEGTVRALYGLSMSENTVHASDSLESARREAEVWFGPGK
ncbi:nucleoside-diphosphate kinase [Youngiibacter multivorans]|uniref:Nucleoside diphosphate kinase n=1 Tax=Youngiibacter multivorans TaxID=937251 RepID=A0ABS4G2P0_9CLOT|nr:nucleoside-diphosphate kinase [Youngiibacter multivorans]MBP1918809.1 nucleoside-diphosphate kinase [Youngiibacter multivorans]